MSDVLRPLDQLLATLTQTNQSLPDPTASAAATTQAVPAAQAASSEAALQPPAAPRLTGRRGRAPRLVKPEPKERVVHTPQQRLLILDHVSSGTHLKTILRNCRTSMRRLSQ